MTERTTTIEAAGGIALTGKPALELRNVNASYGTTSVLRDVSLRVEPGSVTALIGPNGAGKTTSLRVASGLIRPSSGQVLIDGDEVTRTSAARRSRAGLCHVPEGRGVYRNLTVRENLLMQSNAFNAQESIEIATGVFPRLGERLNQKAGTMSGGEQQMLALSAAYVANPRLVLVDEPSLGLAPIIVDLVFDFLRTLREKGVALLLVDQYALRTLSIADHAYVLRRGEIAYDGSAETLLQGNVLEQYIGDGAA
ncbi:ABC transporter ATP-binding protein [Rhodococcus sp. NCIMB 12038]|jgi:branched-chain amino acid transport system ATP-binding protein|uniref:ABC transporter ATP-binding protein n=1 Tax=Rhodococcus sp. NCIMB 12038 TaxID=933800 RepID=UPI000B3C4AA5|nr:ABC transporter ATP-binding protein [Rhodococcus sp. NCIMB 12038]OUS95004.1 ABC transporter ATP-binding protein [Rhodococcus sp. NCIMB 12038]